MKKYNYVIFCPYFGYLPNNINLWLKSCSSNKDFKFYIFTDDNIKLILPSNVELIHVSFDQFRKYVQSKFDFKISLDSPYKLCDFKSSYGYIFNEYLNNCEYWGACDLDLIFGDLKKFLPSKKYDKISTRGHLMLLKNCKEINQAFMINNTSKITYRDILSNKMHFASDEIGNYNINNILEKNGYKIYHLEQYIADISATKNGLAVIGKKWYNIKRIFSYENGKIISYVFTENMIKKEEYAYMHFQKRKMHLNVSQKSNKFLITYNSFINYNKITKELIINNQPSSMIGARWLKFKIKGFIKRFKRSLLIHKIENQVKL